MYCLVIKVETVLYVSFVYWREVRVNAYDRLRAVQSTPEARKQTFHCSIISVAKHSKRIDKQMRHSCENIHWHKFYKSNRQYRVKFKHIVNRWHNMDECQNVIAFNELDLIDDATDCMNMVNIPFNALLYVVGTWFACFVYIWLQSSQSCKCDAEQQVYTGTSRWCNFVRDAQSFPLSPGNGLTMETFFCWLNNV